MTTPDPRQDMVAALRHHALRVFTVDELQTLDRVPRLNFFHLLGKRLKKEGPPPTLEASGGITLENAAEVGRTGVDFISVGALTHSAPNLDFSLLVEIG